MSFASKCRLAAVALACGLATLAAVAQVTGSTPIPQIQDPVLGTTGPYQLRNAPAQDNRGTVYVPSAPSLNDIVPGRYVPGEFEVYELVGPGDEDYDNNKILTTSPIGQGLLGKKKGEVAEIKVPMGLLRYEIVEIADAPA